MSRRLYAIHRWISAVAFVQLAVWTLTGFFFVVVPMKRVHGEHLQGVHDVPIGQGPGALSPSTAMACMAAAGMPDVSRLDLRATPAGLFYTGHVEARALRLDARTCAVAPVDRLEAEETARRDQAGRPRVRSSELIEVAGIEYRGKPLPAWRVVLDESNETTIYVDARTGEITARRNGVWRVYDFLFSLHIMSYETRDDFNHPLIIGAASLAMLTVFSGLSLWMLRVVRRLRSRRPRALPEEPTQPEHP
jgi:PepSY-associated TM region